MHHVRNDHVVDADNGSGPISPEPHLIMRRSPTSATARCSSRSTGAQRCGPWASSAGVREILCGCATPDDRSTARSCCAFRELTVTGAYSSPIMLERTTIQDRREQRQWDHSPTYQDGGGDRCTRSAGLR